MPGRFQRANLAPECFVVVSVHSVGENFHILLRSRCSVGTCPDCGRPTRRVQSRYVRRPSDLPLSGRRVILLIEARRFWCDVVVCGRRIFCEQFNKGVLTRYSRRTQRLETIVHQLGLALGGRPGAAFAQRLMMPVSKDTLLRVVRRRVSARCDELNVIGIDDFAFRRGQTYGTIVCDLERRKPVTLLPDRALETSRAWLARHPSISIVARDRGGGYGEAIAKGLPDAEQVADRWEAGARNASALWREMRSEGFVGQRGIVSQWAQRRRLAEKANQSGLARTPSARVLARLMTSARDGLARSEAILVAVIEDHVPDLVAARQAISEFQSMIRSKSAARLCDWLDSARGGLVSSFVNGVERDLAAVRNAMVSQWSNGQTEGQITRLKLIKRQMYGRAKLDLLEARLVGAN